MTLQCYSLSSSKITLIKFECLPLKFKEERMALKIVLENGLEYFMRRVESYLNLIKAKVRNIRYTYREQSAY